MKTILIAGQSGLIGNELSEQLKGYTIIGAYRKDFQLSDEAFAKKFQSADIILNFTGMPIIKRWNAKNRKEIVNSRLLTIRKIGRLLEMGRKKERHYIGASAIGLYPNEGTHSEKSSLRGEGFLREVVEAWEKETLSLDGKKTRIVIVRLGVVLSEQGGMMKNLLPLFRLGLGGKHGSGKQTFAWIHMSDLTGAISHIIEKKGKGIYNLVSPGVCSNLEFTRILAKELQKPARFHVPEFALKFVYGKAAAVITQGQNAVPDKLRNEGFIFKYPEISKAVEDIVN